MTCEFNGAMFQLKSREMAAIKMGPVEMGPIYSLTLACESSPSTPETIAAIRASPGAESSSRRALPPV